VLEDVARQGNGELIENGLQDLQAKIEATLDFIQTQATAFDKPTQ